MYWILDAKYLDITKASCVTKPIHYCWLGILKGIGTLGTFWG